MPYHFTNCGMPPLKQFYGRFRGGRQQGGRRAVVLLSSWIPHAWRACLLDMTAMVESWRCSDKRRKPKVSRGKNEKTK
jgi:hypothetical protein